jgi:tetratricopeptide (TPR) repeat protein
VPKRSVLFAVLIKAFEAFVTEVGGKARSVWSDQKKLPPDLNDISGLIRHLQSHKPPNGRNQQLRKWPGYKNWNFGSVEVSLKAIKKCRDNLYHQPLSISAEMVGNLLSSIIRVLEELKMDTSCWEKLQELNDSHCIHCSDSDNIRLRVSREVDAEAVRMQIGFSARELTGRGSLIKKVTEDIIERANRGEHSRTALTGRSGVGKTVLAREICNKLFEVLPLQPMLLGTSRETLRIELARLGRAFTPTLPEQSDEEQAAEAALHFFASTTGYVLLVDDAEDIDELWTLLPRDPTGRQAGHVLFTTQKPAQEGQLTAVHEVGVLSTDESMELLEKDRGRDDTRVKIAVLQDGSIDLRGFVEHELGNLPLAVSMVKSALKGLDVPGASKVMARLRQSVVLELGGYQESRYLRTLEGLVQELIDGRLKRRCRDGAVHATATRLLSMLCVLDADGTPDELISAASGSAAMLELSIEALVDVGLVASDRLNGLSYMHALYQKCTFHYFQRGLCVSLMSWGCIWHSLEREFTSLASDPGAHKMGLIRRYRSARCAANCSGDKTVQQKLGQSSVQLDSIHRASLHTAIGRVGQKLMHDWENAKTYFTSALKIYESFLPKDHPDVAASLSDLASLHQDMGQYMQALPFNERALAIREATLGPDHHDVAASLNNLATLLQTMGHLKQALPLHERALAINEATLGSDHPNLATSLSNLASLHQAMGQHKHALPLHEQALAIREATLGPAHPDVAVSLSNLALLHEALGQHKQALPLLERALAISEAALGPEHSLVAVILSNLASLHKDMGQDMQALPLQERALAISEATLGSDHPDVARSLNNLASLHQAMGQHKEALPLYEKALAIREATLGPAHPDVAVSLSSLASLYQDASQHMQSLPLLERALAIREVALGPDHHDVAVSLYNLALIYKAVDQHEQALPLHERALAICEATLDPDHPSLDVVKILNSLASLYQAIGQHIHALPLQERALAIREAALGPDHLDVATSLYYLATLHQEMRQHEQALPLHTRALMIREAKLGLDNPSTVPSLSSLAFLHEKMGQHKKALSLHERVLKISEATLCPDHPDVVTSLFNLASLHNAMGQHMQALPLYERALAIKVAAQKKNTGVPVQRRLQQQQAAKCLAGSDKDSVVHAPPARCSMGSTVAWCSAAQGEQGLESAAAGALAASHDAEDGRLVCVWCGERQPRYSCKCGASYCGVPCQKADWSTHKKVCAWRAAEKGVPKGERAGA